MILRNRRDLKKNPRIFGDDWVTKEDRDQHHSEVNNDNDRSNGASPTNSREHPVAIESKRTQKKNRRYIGDEWENDKENEEHVELSGNNQNMCTARLPKKRAIMHAFDWDAMAFEQLERKPPKNFGRHDNPDEPGPSVLRKKNRRYLGDDWDNGVESDDHQDGRTSQETCIAHFPRRPPVVHQVDREMMVNGHLEENALEHFDGHAAPDELEVSSSDEEWLPHDEEREEIIAMSDDDLLHESDDGVSDDSLLPEEDTRVRRQTRHAPRSRRTRIVCPGLGDAMDVEYLDHGGFCHTCEHCNAGLYDSEVVKKDGRITGGSLCCHNGKAAWLETHFPEMPDSTKRQENIYNPD